MAQVRIGISGWRYAGWRGVFYPEGLPQKRELAFAAERLDSVEINGSFYSLQRPESYARWYAETPPGFVFAVKGSRYISHLLKLRNVDAALANFFASGVLALDDKLGPILWQLPPQLAFDERLAAFLDRLPVDTLAAAELARGHDARLRGRACFGSGTRRPLRYALEVRHPSFRSAELIATLRERNVALVVADTAGRWPFIEDVTADFVYVRLHGATELYRSGYGRTTLRRWAERVASYAAGKGPEPERRIGPRAPARRAGRDVFVYFDNDANVRAPVDAMALRRLLGLAAARTRLARSGADRPSAVR